MLKKKIEQGLMDVEIDTTSAAAASSGDGGETKSDGSPKPVTTEVEKRFFS